MNAFVPLVCRLAFALATGGVLGSAAAADRSKGPYSYAKIKVADDVYAFIETKMHPIVSGNVIAVIGKDATLVFDTGHHPPMARAIAEDIRQLDGKPVRYVAISHWHDDHWVGNAEFASRFPSAQFIAHPFTAELMDSRRDKFSGAPCKKALQDEVRPARDQLAGGKKRDGSPLPDDIRAELTDWIAAYDEQIREYDQMRYRGIDLTFDSAITIDLGGRTVKLMHLGRGNTAGDIVAYVPDARLLLTGDLLVYPVPFATQSYITEWALVLRKLDAMDVDVIVPGHGPVMHDRKYLDDVADLLEDISRQAHAVYKPGMSADELRRQIDISAQSDKFSHGDRFIKLNFDNLIGNTGIDRMWQELSGEWKPEGD